MSEPLVQVFDLSVRYLPSVGQPLLAVDKINLGIGANEIVGVLGESGSGKSTVAAAILRLLPQNAECEGSIFFKGRDLLSAKESELRRIWGAEMSLIPQEPAACLNPVIRIGAQISEVLQAHLSLDRAQRKDKVEELLSEMGFEEPKRIAMSYPHQLSGGQRQRVVIAQAVACQPAFVIADEPTSKLDTHLAEQIRSLIAETVRRQRLALLWITHDPATLLGFADRTAIMYAGKIVEDGVTSSVVRQPIHFYTRKLMRLSEEYLQRPFPNERVPANVD